MTMSSCLLCRLCRRHRMVAKTKGLVKMGWQEASCFFSSGFYFNLSIKKKGIAWFLFARVFVFFWYILWQLSQTASALNVFIAEFKWKELHGRIILAVISSADIKQVVLLCKAQWFSKSSCKNNKQITTRLHNVKHINWDYLFTCSV